MAVSLHLDPPDLTTASATGSGVISLWQALLFAFLGGIILNLMPCVLPVLSLKIMGFVNQAQEEGRSPLAHGLVFTLGVLVSFWSLVGLLLGLQAGGQQLGWGFQLQSPVFLIVLSTFMFLFGLNMLGVFEIGTSLTRVNTSRLTGGWGGSFFSGVLATVVATPCTAPFMGSALGFSLTQPPHISLLIFTFLGLGMAAPYLVLSASPALLRFVPKPGPWMETLKQVMGFLLLGTVVWLMWVLGVQAGTHAVTALAGALLLISIGAWVIGRWGSLSAAASRRTVAYLVAILLIAGGVATAVLGVRMGSPSVSETARQGSIAWQPFSPEKLAELRAADKPVFIDFTAAWCLSCQVNEQVAFSSEEVQRKFSQLGIVPLKADWTSRDGAITRALAEHGRNSVPLYVLYGTGDQPPIILPEILSPGIVLDALKQIES
jgi:thiol:disulfide interchange protein DsbD